MSNSFYGGRRGSSFILAGSFASVEDMAANFKNGYDYKEIGLDEYVLIDPQDTNNLDNGKIYRRGYNFTNELGGAEYIGQIAGPAGPVSTQQIMNYTDVKAKAEEIGVPLQEGESSILNDNLLSGETNDTIKWAACQIKDSNSNNATVYLGFAFPYTVIDFTAEATDPYAINSLANRIDTKEKPFYEKWNLKIPKGVKGDTFQNLRLIDGKNNDQVNYNTSNSEDLSIIEALKKQKELDKTNNNKILVYDYYNYDSNPIGTLTTYFLGQYNTIKNISLSPEGLFNIEYTAQDSVSTNLIWPTNLIINDETQKLEVTYNNGNTIQIGVPLNYIKRIAINPIDAHLLVLYSDPNKKGSITYENIDGWNDLGNVRSYNGILIGCDLDENALGLASKEELQNNNLVLEKLQSKYPHGLGRNASTNEIENNDLIGKIVTIIVPSVNKPGENQTKFFAFNYLTNTWYYLGDFGNSIDSIPIMSGSVSPENEAKFENLANGAMWFIIEDETPAI